MAKDISSPFLQYTTQPATSPGASCSAFNPKSLGSKPAVARKRSWQDFGSAGEIEIRLPVRHGGKSVSPLGPSTLGFSPLRLLERADLPLAFLDTANGEDTKTAGLESRFFVSKVQALENCLGNGDKAGSMLLVARQREDGRLYAIERVRVGVYAICRLGSWVQVEDLQSRAVGGWFEARTRLTLDGSTGQTTEWWKSAAMKSDAVTLERSRKRIKVSMAPPPAVPEQEFQKQAPVISTSTTTTENHPRTIPLPLNEPVQAIFALENSPCELVQPQITKETLFENLVTQYLESLYLSRASLAFFAKGPLSRIRAAFSIAGSEMRSSDLVTFLRSMLLTLPSMDKKFKEKLPTLVRELSPLSSDEEDTNVSPERKKKRRSKKRRLKLSKEGVYPFEDEYIKRWWKGNEENSTERVRSHETAEQTLRRRIGDLQIRETLSQIILLLEILAFEASCLSAPAMDEKGKRKRKPQDLKTLLDLLVDKLTIWQSVEHEEEYLPLTQGNGQKDNKDRLGSFCTEVIIPFYKSRVPNQATQIIKKFGGPGLLSPEKSRKPAASKPKDQPASKDAANKNSRRTLQKTASEVPLKRRPGLSRSVTDSAAIIPGIKREASESRSLSTISLLSDKPKPARRDSLASLKHLKARQINLNEISATANLKRKRKEQLEEDLKTAIANVKRPNRGGVGLEVVAEREKRRTNIGSSKKGSRISGAAKGERKVLHTVPNVQVLATPHHGRRTDIFAQALPLPQMQASPEEINHVPSSGLQTAISSNDVIPGTEVKNTSSVHQNLATKTPSRTISKAVMFDSISKPPSSAGVFESVSGNEMILGSGRGVVVQTPPRGSSKMPLFTAAAKRAISRQSHSRPSFTAMERSSFKQQDRATVPSTPLKVTSAETGSIIPSIPAPTRQRTGAERKESDSIYDALGWDDDDIDELA